MKEVKRQHILTRSYPETTTQIISRLQKELNRHNEWLLKQINRLPKSQFSERRKMKLFAEDPYRNQLLQEIIKVYSVAVPVMTLTPINQEIK